MKAKNLLIYPMQKDEIKDDVNMNLVQMITTRSVEEQCSKITKWLKKHYSLDVIGFFLKEPETTRSHFFTETSRMNVVQNLEEVLVRVYQIEKTENEVLLFAQKGEKIEAISLREDLGYLEPMGIAIPLGILGRSIGVLALVADSQTIQDFITETPARLSFVPLISTLLDNAFSHEMNDKKIRMLNLYQTVSSSLAYIGDLQELLSTIISIVTSELHCEECSVLLYDEDNSEFEFFTAIGQTGMELVKKRFPSDRGIAGRALRERRSQVVNDVQRDPDFYRLIDEEHNFKTKSILSVPVFAGEERVGILNAINKVETKYFDKEDDQILSAIADEVALAVKNAKLFDYVVNSYCKIRMGLNSCKDCKRPLKSWTPCLKQLEERTPEEN
jgi:putative methionine-R-sulfoxide reductase with GAF domain